MVCRKACGFESHSGHLGWFRHGVAAGTPSHPKWVTLEHLIARQPHERVDRSGWRSRNPVIARMEKEAKRNGGYAGFGTATATATTAHRARRLRRPAGATRATEPVGAPMTVTDVVVRTAAMFVAAAHHRVRGLDLQVGSRRHRPDRDARGHRPRLLGHAVEEDPSDGVPGVRRARGRRARWASASGCRTYVDQSNWRRRPEPTPTSSCRRSSAPSRRSRPCSSSTAPASSRSPSRFKKMMTDRDGRLPRHRHRQPRSPRSSASVTAGASTESAGLGLLLCVAGVALASFSLALDFDAIETGRRARCSRSRSRGAAALGLIVTLVWLYLEILRLPGDPQLAASTALARHRRRAADPFTRAAAPSSVGRAGYWTRRAARTLSYSCTTAVA